MSIRFAGVFLPLLIVALLWRSGGLARGDDHLPKSSDWVLVGPNKGWWKEVQVPLGQRVWLGDLGGPSVWLTLSNDTIVAFTAQINSNYAQNVVKRKGLLTVDPREVLTLICTGGDRTVYYVDDAKAAHGYAKLRLEAP